MLQEKKNFTVLIALLSLFLMIGYQDNGIVAEASSSSAHHLEQVPEGYRGIYTAEDLNAIRENLNDKYILMNDIDLSAATSSGGQFFNDGQGWKPIGSKEVPFKGILDGNGYSLIGMNINILSTDKRIYAGLFGYASDAEFKNISISDSSIAADNQTTDPELSDAYAGGVMGYGYNVTLTNVSFSGNIQANSLLDSYAGGIAGKIDASYSNISVLTSIQNDGEINAKKYSGGIAGSIYRTEITEAENEGDINLALPNSASSGGIAGYAYQSTIAAGKNNGKIHFKNEGGGIVGRIYSSSIIDSVNTGTIQSSSEYSNGGGIVGESQSSSSVKTSYNTGTVKANTSAGGIVGTAYSTIIAESYNAGETNGHFSGGITGYTSRSSMKDTYNIGVIDGTYDAGGIAGYGTESNIQTSYNVGRVIPHNTSYSDEGGIAGEFNGTILNSYYLDSNHQGVEEGPEEGTFKKTFQEMKDSATFEAYNFNTLWTIGNDSSFMFPQLQQLPAQGKESSVEIIVKNPPEKVSYIEGEELDLTGGILTSRTNYGNEKEVEMIADMASNYEKDRVGEQSIRLTYEGVFTTLKITVTERDKTPPEKPVVNSVTDQSTSISGQAEAGSVINIYVNEELIGTGPVAEDGTFTIQIPLQKAHTLVNVTATDTWGNVSAETAISVQDVTPPSMPSVNGVTDQMTIVTGKAEADSTVNVFDQTSMIGSSKAGQDGTFNVLIPLQAADTELFIHSTDSSGNTSEVLKVIVKDVTAPSKPSVSQIFSDSTNVTGNSEPNSTIDISSVNEIIGTGRADAEGHFKITIPIQEAGSIITVTATDTAGNKSAPISKQIDGWKVVDGNRYYLLDGTHLTGWQQINEQRYYFNDNGVYKTGWMLLDGSWYYFESNGMKTDWLKSNGKWYFLNKDGMMATGWKKVSGVWYFLEQSGAMKTGWLKSGSKWYYLDKSGAMKTGWGKVDGEWYYFESNGTMKTGWLKIVEWFYLGKDGAMVTGWQEIGGKWYYFYPSGVNHGLMAFNTMVGSYYVGPDGAWVKDY
ncbi:hypothetical protein A6P54_12940 [Bacillus sp. MKU004]|nr:hypothetical protein A6P54_12940 [Bacillus sp. MKU004]